MFGLEIAKTTLDIAKGVNTTVWGGIESAEKVSIGVKTGLSAADDIIGTSHAIEDISCGTLDVIGSVSSTSGIVFARILGLKQYTSITVCCMLPWSKMLLQKIWYSLGLWNCRWVWFKRAGQIRFEEINFHKNLRIDL